MNIPAVEQTKPSLIVALGKSVLEVGGVKKLMKFAVVTIDFMGKIQVPVQLKEIQRSFKECSSTLSFFATVGIVKSWMVDKKTRWQETAALINFTGLQAISSAMFLDKVKIINLSFITMTIGKTPVLSFAMTTLGFGDSIFSLWDTIRESREMRANSTNCLRETEDWSQKRNAIKELPDDPGKVRQKIQDYFGPEVVESVINLNVPDKKEYLEKRLNYEVTKWETNAATSKSKLDKVYSGLVMSIVTLAISILGLAGEFYGIAVLAATSLPMMTVALVMAGFAVFQMLSAHMKERIVGVNPLESAKNQLMIAARTDDPSLVPA